MQYLKRNDLAYLKDINMNLMETMGGTTVTQKDSTVGASYDDRSRAVNQM